MSIVGKPFTFSAGAVIVASQHNSDFDTMYSDYNGNIDNTNIASGAGILASKLNQAIAGAIGATTPNTGAFTTLSATGAVVLSSTLKLGTTNQGDILYDNGTSLVRLTPGTSGYFLQTLGAGANPLWTQVINRQKFIASGTFTAPSGITMVYITAVGGGAGGGDGNTGIAGGGGGGAGAWCSRLVYPVTPAGNYTVTIGTGGAAGSTGDGGNGVATSFDTLSLNGGSGGVYHSTGGAGGTSSNTLNAVNGAAGGIAGPTQVGGNGAAGSASATPGGGGGGSPLGLGGTTGTAPIANTGGGGCGRSKDGTQVNTAGATGVCIVEW